MYKHSLLWNAPKQQYTFHLSFQSEMLKCIFGFIKKVFFSYL